MNVQLMVLNLNMQDYMLSTTQIQDKNLSLQEKIAKQDN